MTFSVSKKLQIWLFIVSHKFKESMYITELIYSTMLLLGLLSYIFPNKHIAFKLLSQVHRSSRLPLLRSLAFPYIKKSIVIHKKARNPGLSIEQFKESVGRRIICIKPKVSELEKGVLFIKYSESMPLLPHYCDMERLLTDYTLVYEPSWSGYCTSDILHFTKYKQNIFFLAKQQDDYAFLKKLNCNLRPLTMGPCDWVDPAVASSFIGSQHKFDIVINSNWGPAKRHHVLFKALVEIPSSLRVALIGFDWEGRTKAEILDLAYYYGIEHQLSIFEKIDFAEVMKINSCSKVAVLLSLKEGSNRAISESLFCDTPAIVLRNHIGGIVENITPQTGRLVDESALGSEIMLMLGKLADYSPRKWALNNISCFESTKSMNESLKKDAIAQGYKWTKDIVTKTNSPDLRYFDNNEAAECTLENDKLEDYIRVP